jgi:hypothetical protein
VEVRNGLPDVGGVKRFVGRAQRHRANERVGFDCAAEELPRRGVGFIERQVREGGLVEREEHPRARRTTAKSLISGVISRV